MKTLLISNVFPPQTGGSGRWFYEIYRRFSEMEVTVVAGEHDRAREFDPTCELTIHRTNLKFDDWGTFNLRGYKRYQQAAKQCRKLVQGESFDALHAGSLLPDGWLVRKLARKMRVPYTVFMHGEETCFASQSRQLKWMGQRILKDAAQIVANSENTYRLLSDYWGVSTDRATILNPGVDCRVFEPAERNRDVRRELGWDERPVILTVGRLQRRKGQATMIEAMPRLLERHPDLLYCIVGDGDQRASLVELVNRLELTSHVQFLHDCTDERLVQCYQQCDLFILPNREINGDIEGFGMVLLEAQACGRPVIAGDSGGTAETMQVGETGLIADCRSPENLITVVFELLDNEPRRREMGVAGREWVLQQFDWNSLSEKAANVFQNASAGTNSPAVLHH